MVEQPILVIGAEGQLARALARLQTAAGHPIACRGRPEADINDADALRALLAATAPAAVVNAAAYTAVDAAETSEPAAHALNAHGPAQLARLCSARGIPFVHVSTDYVFDGSARTPYRETDAIAPLGVYGASKAAGEAAIRESCPHHLILRTSWLYDGEGRNFLTTMLRLGAEREALSIVADQRGAPTWTEDLAAAIAAMLENVLTDGATDAWGTYHATGSGETTWHGFAAEIFRIAAASGQPTPKLTAITTAEYPTPAARPAYSVLDNAKLAQTFGIRLPEWQDSLARCMARRLAKTQTA
jgi:dTDP-4-dehydrorhamnose reductase